MPKLSKIRGLIAPAIAVAAIGGAAFVTNPVQATHEPADKVSASGATTAVFGPGVASGTETTILSETVRTSKPTDLILGVTLECGITTELVTTGSTTSEASGAIDVWIEIDGTPVPVAQGDTDGSVTFCNRTERRTTSFGDDEEHSIETFLDTKNANGFTWMALDVGAAVHTIEVKARLTTADEGDATATAVIGKRTLIVEPTKAANDEAVTELG